MNKWNGKRFSIYDKEEKQVLGLLNNLGEQTNFNTDEVERLTESNNKKVSHQEMQDTYKIDKQANFTGSWFGIKRPTQSNEGLASTVEQIIDETIPNINSQLEQVSTTTIINDIADTNYKKGDKVDIEELRSRQIKQLNYVIYSLRNKTNTIRFCHIGDSLTYGYDVESTDRRNNTSTFADGTKETTTIASKTYPEVFEEKLRNVFGSSLIAPHINRGRSGDYASISLTRHNLKHNGDISLIMYGTNDARSEGCPYKGDVKQFIYYMEQVIIRELLWDKAVVLLCSPTVKLQFDIRVDSFSNAIKELGRKYCIPVIDTQEIINGYNYTIWSDATHFNGIGYSVLGDRLASTFIGEGLVNTKKVVGGDIITVTDMRSGATYNSGVAYLNSPLGIIDTPEEFKEGYGYYLKYNTLDGKVTFSFYTNENNLFVIPSMYIGANLRAIITVDNGFGACLTTSSSNYKTNENNKGLDYTLRLSSGTTSLRFNKTYCRNNFIKPILIPNKGWHTLTIEIQGDVIGSGCSLFGVEFVSYDVLNNAYKGKKKLLYTSPTSGGYPQIGNDISLLDNITNYSNVIVQSGGVDNDTIYSDNIINFADLNYRITVDKVISKSYNGTIILNIKDEKTLTISKQDDNIRYIWGIVKNDL